MPDKHPQPRLPLGPPLRRTDEELDALAVVTLQDVEEAKGLVRKNATVKGQKLWEALPDET